MSVENTTLIDISALADNPIQLTDSIDLAGKKILSQAFSQMLQANNNGQIEEDPEVVHDMRVSIRQMRSVLRLLGSNYGKVGRNYRNQLRGFAQTLGQIRDLDVLIADVDRYHRSLRATKKKEALQLVMNRFQQQRAKALSRWQKTQNSKSYRKFVKQFTAFLSDTDGNNLSPSTLQVRHIVPMLLHERLAQVRRYDGLLEGAPVELFHRLRVDVKRLRYAVTFFQPVLGTSANDFIEHLKVMQDNLGRLNDISVGTRLLKSLKKLDADEKAIVKAYRKSLREEENTGMETFSGQWNTFYSRTMLRKFSDALLVLR